MKNDDLSKLSTEQAEHYRKTIKKIESNELVTEAIKLLKDKLPPSLHYHVVEHTYDVISETVLFACAENCSDRDLELLVIAAAYHDTGYIERYYDNEECGVAFFKEMQKKIENDLSVDEVERIATMILDTRVNPDISEPLTTCSDPLSKYLLDGDLGNLGRNDSYQKTNYLLEELRSMNPSFEITEKDFLTSTQTLLIRHKWHSEAAKMLRDAGKKINMHAVKLLRIF